MCYFFLQFISGCILCNVFWKLLCRKSSVVNTLCITYYYQNAIYKSVKVKKKSVKIFKTKNSNFRNVKFFKNASGSAHVWTLISHKYEVNFWLITFQSLKITFLYELGWHSTVFLRALNCRWSCSNFWHKFSCLASYP